MYSSNKTYLYTPHARASLDVFVDVNRPAPRAVSARQTIYCCVAAEPAIYDSMPQISAELDQLGRSLVLHTAQHVYTISIASIHVMG